MKRLASIRHFYRFLLDTLKYIKPIEPLVYNTNCQTPKHRLWSI